MSESSSMTIEVKWKPEAEPKEAFKHLRYVEGGTPSEAMDMFVKGNIHLTVRERFDLADRHYTMGIIKTMNHIEYMFLEVNEDEDDWWKDDYDR